ncbi:hypothetical protein HNP37_001435 [Flavobacterium nitrogenifigens]|uniref:TonB-dependent outer membrane receptor, SusC/RagA subfamily, signature region n=2 Tax=Flavobacterium TaxID=237 RepID=A0A7W7IVJ8_9FLAO|nr:MULTISPECIES: hypothetical protein [Flavobacterium]MBB4801374.1 hypothetical protein [Flavobacterium nitrogenifigens]MBB6386331.1 hypothetical protein [Flavobacterium notoginsengisoli]
MDNQDKLFDKIKQASQNAEFKDFPGMEKVWSRVEDKLDKKEDKKTIALWKKIAVAASLLLLISLGFQFLRTDKNVVNETPKVVIQEKEKYQETILEQKNATPSSGSGIVSNEEAVKILENQTKNKESIGLQEMAVPKAEAIQSAPAPQITSEAVVSATAPLKAEDIEESDNMSSKKDAFSDRAYLQKREMESARVAYASESAQKAKKSNPLVVLNGNAMAHSDDAKKDKMLREEMPNFAPENVDSLVILDEPLYIIDGIYYSENDLFGKNPTSPYAPLDKQEIKTITILQDLEATEKYGEKGKKGVVIITTKNGKPAPKK